MEKQEEIKKALLLVEKQKATSWINKRAKSSINSRSEASASKNHEDIMSFARELFNLWDKSNSGKIELSDIISDFIALGLAPTENFAEKVISFAVSKDDSVLELA